MRKFKKITHLINDNKFDTIQKTVQVSEFLHLKILVAIILKSTSSSFLSACVRQRGQGGSHIKDGGRRRVLVFLFREGR